MNKEGKTLSAIDLGEGYKDIVEIFEEYQRSLGKVQTRLKRPLVDSDKGEPELLNKRVKFEKVQIKEYEQEGDRCTELEIIGEYTLDSQTNANW